ncbi:MAG TPA: cytochrome-c oxidase, cbb3-type subunit III [Giesbergeria sp.]|jgi:cytochrome c oxidase cbb3-type subunit 3|uniref:cytochrome-c oxidase, cbb3-type subunit III n=1 Tax=Comamonadaceae TaxID=80864 RepID=UPI0013898A97|nr:MULTISPECIES: cytochrome-c oxidase, cbb3-type subunit III [unclassified Acidovorax]MBL8363787.1 cytochrome-c oxidase, cbb3-type subunit III [Comamonas sp.]MCL4769514.1 cytochrome-c oxidase, cbb3-type subunit III [Burkholderiaceae bacterium]HMZ86530.1 cytochrome-c oxidase, cbb3-type subunit III [Giesbergeria sp.]NCU66497.1 cytochrome-c oxidase, cbb3-type subunit III [Acidovorax sp. 210-6]HNE72414.1 cytochrome-c oxidase, cbb3-type subunit III [Giesbergeria sp.]
MSDFTSNFWSVFVAGVTVISIIACLILLVITARKKVASTADNTTGHVWDEDLTEMNNPMPRWWMWLFVITIVFGFLYLAMYPGLGKFSGQLGWSQVGEYKREMDKGNAEIEPVYARFASMKPEEIAADAQAMAIGERLFMNNCAQCHGSDARGGKSFPNLTDGDWLYGGSPETIRETLHQGRMGMMPPMGDAVGSAENVRNLAHYVMSLSNSPHDSLRANLGKEHFAACAACHGPDGKGNQALGAPNLTDDIWLHGWGEAAITTMINQGKTNQMPAQAGKLTEAQLGVLTAYVWGLSNKPGAAAKR